MRRLWDMLKTERERDYVRSFMPAGWNPDQPLVVTEMLEEIDRLMRQPRRGQATSILVGHTSTRKKLIS